MYIEAFVVLMVLLGFVGFIFAGVSSEFRSTKGFIFGILLVVIAFVLGGWSTYPIQRKYANDGKEITIFEKNGVQWGIIDEDPKRAVNLNKEFGQTISKDESVVIRSFWKGPYKGFLYYHGSPKLQIIKVPHRPGRFA